MKRFEKWGPMYMSLMIRTSRAHHWWYVRVVHVSDETCESRLSQALCTGATITWRIKIKELGVGPVLAGGGGIRGGGRWGGLLEAVQVLLLRLGYHLSHDVIFIHPIRKTCSKQCKTIYLIHKTLKKYYRLIRYVMEFKFNKKYT